MSDILNIDNVSPQYARSAGGKFAGLAHVKPLIDKYVAQYNVPLAIPETYGIKIDTPHNRSFDAAMHAMDVCGGNVAVRFSADIKDVSGKTYSGAFESVLNVDNKDKMKDALDVVYGSAKNVPGAKMGVIIQQMIANPDIAGVLYSSDFNGTPGGELEHYEYLHQDAGTDPRPGLIKCLIETIAIPDWLSYTIGALNKVATQRWDGTFQNTQTR